MLPILPAQRTEYLFTDVGAGLHGGARKRFADAPFIDYQVFDLEVDPERQQIPAGHFDLVLGADVVHATADLRVALRNLRRCLAPGGLLVLLELAKPDFVRDDVTFGLLKGYSRFRDTDLGRTRRLRRRLSGDRYSSSADSQTSRLSTAPAIRRRRTRHPPRLGADAAREAARSNRRQRSHYVLFADRGGVADALAGALRAARVVAPVVVAGAMHARRTGRAWSCRNDGRTRAA